jgi:hypothetical protein
MHTSVVPVVRTLVRTRGCVRRMYVRTYYVRTRVRTKMVHVYVYTRVPVHGTKRCTNITLLPPRYLKNGLKYKHSGATGKLVDVASYRKNHGILRFQIDSDVCSADLHNNPRKHVGLRAPAPASPLLGRSQWSSAPAGSTGGRPGWAPARTYHTNWYHSYTCTNITLSQKRLEIQALRCNGDTS